MAHGTFSFGLTSNNKLGVFRTKSHSIISAGKFLKAQTYNARRLKGHILWTSRFTDIYLKVYLGAFYRFMNDVSRSAFASGMVSSSSVSSSKSDMIIYLSNPDFGSV